MLDKTEDPNGIKDAAEQLSAVIEGHVKKSFGDKEYPRVLEEMKVLKEEMREMEEVGFWNDWLKSFKTRLLKGELGGDRSELWWAIRKEKLGLISKAQDNLSNVDEEDAAKFFSER